LKSSFENFLYIMNGMKAFLNFSLSILIIYLSPNTFHWSYLQNPPQFWIFAKQRMRQNKLYKLLHFEALELLIFQILKGVIYYNFWCKTKCPTLHYTIYGRFTTNKIKKVFFLP
jgi:hypothetical protein